MKKTWALACTIGFSVFWVFAGLAVLAWLDAHPMFATVVVLSLAGLALGIWSRLQLVALTRDLSRGERVQTSDTAEA